MVYGHVKHVGNAFAIVAFAVTHLARNHYVWQEVHLYSLVAVATTCLAASPFHIEREASWLVSTNFSFWKRHEERAYVGEYACVSGWVRSWRATERRLVNVHYLVYIVNAFNGPVGHRFL